jgi:ketosteroid isomerase-like protein
VPRGLNPSVSQSDQARRFYEAFDSQDLEAFVQTLDPHVELQTARGLRIGLAEARSWATRNPHGKLEQRIVIEELREHGTHIVALIRQQWWWAESKELAEDNEVAAMFTFKDGLIMRWQPFTDRAQALQAAGIT